MTVPLEVQRVVHGSDEYAAIIELRREVLRLPLGLDFTEGDLLAEAADVFLGVFSEGSAIGSLVLTPLSETDVQMRQVAVAPALQRSGLGTKLVAESERVAGELGFRRMVVSARANAVAFYERLGYTVVGQPYVEVGIEHLQLVKDISI